ncbi:MAG: hypothetical protein H7338_01305 [Candidatus Sericytochromatia bacterium]|nr:hypothetical protein [Candidatus Sericytochromatia bacterium]
MGRSRPPHALWWRRHAKPADDRLGQPQLGQPDRTRLQNTRVYLLPGTPWPGVADNGGAWTKPWSDALRSMGVGRAVPLNYGGGSDVATYARIFADPFTGGVEKRVMAQIAADLRAKPLAQGERIMIIGHSFGSVMRQIVRELAAP